MQQTAALTIRAMPDLLLHALALLAGVAAGFINTLAGSGSFVVLPALLALGLTSHEANATNRVGVLCSSFVGAARFRQAGAIARSQLAWLLVPSVLGAVVGAALAAKLDPHAFDLWVGALMLAMLALVIFEPERMLKDVAAPARVSAPGSVLALFAIGVYGGFIQAGVGILLLLALSLVAGMPVKRANAAKLLIVFVYTVPALLVFVLDGDVRWWIGLLMAVGQSLGAHLAVGFTIARADANKWIRRLLLVMLPATTIKLWFF